jgi:hypothetical protein
MRDPIFILESPSLSDLMEGRREAPLMEETFKLLAVPYHLERVKNYGDLCQAAALFRTTEFRVLHISAHGMDNGAGLIFTDDSTLEWPAFLELFQFKNPKSFLTLSSCFALKGPSLISALKLAKFAPAFAIGPRTAITWASSAIVNVALSQSLRSREATDIFAALTGIYLMYGIDLHAVPSAPAAGEPDRTSGAQTLQTLARSLIAGRKEIFMMLVRSRGLLDKDEGGFDWDDFWIKQEAAWKRVEEARANTDRHFRERGLPPLGGYAAET